MSSNHITIDCINGNGSSIIPHHIKLCTQHTDNLVFKVKRKEIRALITNHYDVNQYFAHYVHQIDYNLR
jgi:hypothetical protein